jgi:hypothetical protein
VATKCKGLLCFLALLFLLAGFIFTSNYSHTVVLGPYRSTQSVLSAQPQTWPLVAENAPDQHAALSVTQHSPDFSPDHLSTYHLIGTTGEGAFFYPDIRQQLSTSALLLPVIARSLGLSTLVLRE